MVGFAFAFALKSKPLFGNKGAAAPYIALDNLTISEDSAVSTVVGALSIVGSVTGTPSYSISADPDDKFDISSANLIIDDTVDYETATFHLVTVSVSGLTPSVPDRQFIIAVLDVVEGITYHDRYYPHRYYTTRYFAERFYP